MEGNGLDYRPVTQSFSCDLKFVHDKLNTIHFKKRGSRLLPSCMRH